MHTLAVVGLNQGQIDYVNQIAIYIVFGVSLNLLLGYAGLASVAPAAFGAIGGFSVAWLWSAHHDGLDLGLPVALGLTLVVGLIIGVVGLRLSLLWLVVLTISLSTIVPDVIITLEHPYLGGTDGLSNIIHLPFLGFRVGQPSTLFPLAAGAAIVAFAVCWRVGESPYGRVLRGIRDDVDAVEGLGKNVLRFKLQVFGLTSVLFGLAGALSVLESTVASSNTFGFSQSLAIFAMVVLGGLGNLWGSVLGAVLVVLSTPFFQDVLGFNPLQASLWRLAAYGIALVLVVRFRPQGLLPEGSHYARGLLDRLQHRGVETTGGEGHDGAGGPPPVGVLDRPERRRPMGDLVGGGGRAAIVQARGLTKAFGGIKAVDGVDIDLLEGQITALVGPNGAGKTTVFNLIAGAVRPDAGSVLLNGQEIVGRRSDEIAKLGMVRSYQDVRLFAQLTALQNVAAAVPEQSGESLTRLFGMPREVARSEARVREAASRWLDFVGMGAAGQQVAGSLSYGEQKLVALARVLATEASVILLDEPASGVEANWVDVILEMIKRVRDEGRTICVVEHNMHVIEDIAQVTYFVETGTVAAVGDIATLLQDARLAEVYFGTT